MIAGRGRMLSQALALGGLLALLPTSGVAARKVTIDDFNNAVTTAFPPGVVQSTLGSTTVTDPPTGALNGVVGGVRQLTVTATHLDIPGLDNVTAGAAELADFFAYACTLGAVGNFDLLYDAGGAGLNLSLKGLSQFELTVVAADGDSVPYDVTVTVVDNSLTSATSTQQIATPGPQVVVFPLSSFPGVDLGAIRSVELFVAPMPNKAADMEFARFDVVGVTPAPLLSSAMLLGLVGILGLIGIAGVARSN